MAKSSGPGRRDADRVYDDLRKRILTLGLDPGAMFDESRIVGEMGTSRTPVREAVIRLVSEGLLHRDGRQIRVSAFQVSQLRAFFEAVTLLSRSICRMAAARRSSEQLKGIHARLVEFEREVVRGDEIRISESNHAFHKAIAEAADSAFLQRAYEDLLVESLRLSRQCFAAGGKRNTWREHMKSTIADHREIYNAIKQHDIGEVDRLAAQHAKLFRERLSQQILGPSTEASTLPLSD